MKEAQTTTGEKIQTQNIFIIKDQNREFRKIKVENNYLNNAEKSSTTTSSTHTNTQHTQSEDNRLYYQ